MKLLQKIADGIFFIGIALIVYGVLTDFPVRTVIGFICIALSYLSVIVAGGIREKLHPDI